ncbi:hypothetical protein [Clostridium neonatale]|uniref:hypothetical protein n=1 Tax=Clostridium neonatale TaxID=137838 RepID=UPI0031407A1D
MSYGKLAPPPTTTYLPIVPDNTPATPIFLSNPFCASKSPACSQVILSIFFTVADACNVLLATPPIIIDVAINNERIFS